MVRVFWAAVNLLRRWREDRQAPECAYLKQLYDVWTYQEPKKVLPFMNLIVSRDRKRRVA